MRLLVSSLVRPPLSFGFVFITDDLRAVTFPLDSERQVCLRGAVRRRAFPPP